MDEHDETHETGGKYRCCLRSCKKTFLSIDDVIAHGVEIHKRFPSYVCPVATCRVPYDEFKNNRDLNVHVRDHHPEENI